MQRLAKLFLLLAFLGACSSPPEQRFNQTVEPALSASTTKPGATIISATTITFVTDLMFADHDDIPRVIEAFQVQHPDISVQIKSSNDLPGQYSFVNTARNSDCFEGWPPPESDNDLKEVLNLQPLLDADSTFSKDDYPPILFSPYQHNSDLFGVPFAITADALMYNRAVFEKVGVKPPTSRWTTSDFLATAQRLTMGNGEQKQYGYVPTNASEELLFFVHQFGGRLTSGSGENLRPNFDDPKVIEAVQWFINLDKVHKIMPPLRFSYQRNISGNSGSDELVMSGRAGMWLGGGLWERDDPSNGAAPLPIGGGRLIRDDSHLFWRALHISAHTRHSQACWEWIKFLSADVRSLNDGDLPARISVAQSDSFAKRVSFNVVELAKEYGEALKNVEKLDDADHVERLDLYWFFKAISATIEHDTDLAQGLAEAQKMTTVFMECQARGGKPAICASQVDPNYQGYNTENTPTPSRVTPTTLPTAQPTTVPLSSQFNGEIAYVRDGDIWLLDLTTGQAKRLTNDGHSTNPAWSPDGQWLAFTSKREGNFDIYLMRADGSETKRMTNSPLDETLPAFSVREGTLFYVRTLKAYEGPGTDAGHYVIVKRNSSGAESVVYDVGDGVTCAPSALSLSSDELLALSLECSLGTNIDLVDLGSKEPKVVGSVDDLEKKADKEFCAPQLLHVFEVLGKWAHTQPSLAFIGDADCADPSVQGWHPGIFIQTFDHPNQESTVIFSGKDNEGIGSVDWSPDDKWLAFDKYNPTRKSNELWVVNSQGGQPQEVSMLGSSPAWRPVGAK